MSTDAINVLAKHIARTRFEDLPEEVQDQAVGLKTLYAVHDENGERLALVRDRTLAFVLAKQNNLDPVTVH